jgi:hypothetical protein
MRRAGSIVSHVLDLLGDGKPRTGEEIANELHERFGNSKMAVRSELSYVGHLRQIARSKRGKLFEYRRTDVEVSAA